MKKVLLFSLFSVFAYANNPVKEDPKEIKKVGTVVCSTSAVSGSIGGNQTNFTTSSCITLSAGYSIQDQVGAQISTQACADGKRDEILGILTN